MTRIRLLVFAILSLAKLSQPFRNSGQKAHTPAGISGAVLSVEDPTKSVQFYTKHLNLCGDESSHSVKLINDVSIQFIKNPELVKVGENIFGLSLMYNPSQVPSVPNIMENLPRKRIIQPFGHYFYGASMIPDEDFDVKRYVKYGILSDHDGFAVELHQQDINIKPTTILTLRVLDLNESIDFYTKRFGLKLFRKRSNVSSHPSKASMCAFLGNGMEFEGCILQLLYLYGTEEKIRRGNSFRKLKLRCDDIEETKKYFGASEIVNPSRSGFEVIDPSGHEIILQQIGATLLNGH